MTIETLGWLYILAVVLVLPLVLFLVAVFRSGPDFDAPVPEIARRRERAAWLLALAGLLLQAVNGEWPHRLLDIAVFSAVAAAAVSGVAAGAYGREKTYLGGIACMIVGFAGFVVAGRFLLADELVWGTTVLIVAGLTLAVAARLTRVARAQIERGRNAG